MALTDIGSSKFSNTNLNAVGSEYAATYNHDLSLMVQKQVNRNIFDARPFQFMDLKLLNMLPRETNFNGDEGFYQEWGWQREAIIVTSAAAAVSYPTTQTFTVGSLTSVHTDVMISYPNGQLGNIIAVDLSTSTITVSPLVNNTLPAVSVSDTLGNHSSVDHAGSEGFAVHQRGTTIERNFYIQLFNRAIRYDEVELNKLKYAGTTNNYLALEMEELYNQNRIDISNALWMGIQGEVPTSKGKPAKTTKGVWTSVIEAGSPNATGVTDNTLVEAFEQVVFESEYGKYGQVRMAFMTNEMHRKISNAYKQELTRYAPSDKFAGLNLQSINIGSSTIVPVPFARFNDSSSFPEAFKKRMVILDIENLTPVQMWGERAGQTPDLNSNGTPVRYKDYYIDCNFGLKINNPLANAYLEMA